MGLDRYLTEPSDGKNRNVTSSVTHNTPLRMSELT